MWSQQEAQLPVADGRPKPRGLLAMKSSDEQERNFIASTRSLPWRQVAMADNTRRLGSILKVAMFLCWF